MMLSLCNTQGVSDIKLMLELGESVLKHSLFLTLQEYADIRCLWVHRS